MEVIYLSFSVYWYSVSGEMDIFKTPHWPDIERYKSTPAESSDCILQVTEGKAKASKLLISLVSICKFSPASQLMGDTSLQLYNVFNKYFPFSLIKKKKTCSLLGWNRSKTFQMYKLHCHRRQWQHYNSCNTTTAATEIPLQPALLRMVSIHML